MPFRSEKQRRYLWAKHPEIAKEWAHKYPDSNKGLPMYAHDKKEEDKPVSKAAALNALKVVVVNNLNSSVKSIFASACDKNTKKADSKLEHIKVPQSDAPTYAGERKLESILKPETEDEGSIGQERSEKKPETCENMQSNPLLSKLAVVLAPKIQQEIENIRAQQEAREAQRTPQNVNIKKYPVQNFNVPPPMGMTAPPQAPQAPQQPQQAPAQPQNGQLAPVGGGNSPNANPINSFGGLSSTGDINGNAALGTQNMAGGEKMANKLNPWHAAVQQYIAQGYEPIAAPDGDVTFRKGNKHYWWQHDNPKAGLQEITPEQAQTDLEYSGPFNEPELAAMGTQNMAGGEKLAYGGDQDGLAYGRWVGGGEPIMAKNPNPQLAAQMTRDFASAVKKHGGKLQFTNERNPYKDEHMMSPEVAIQRILAAKALNDSSAGPMPDYYFLDYPMLPRRKADALLRKDPNAKIYRDFPKGEHPLYDVIKRKYLKHRYPDEFPEQKQAAAQKCSCGCGQKVNECTCPPSCSCRQKGGSCYGLKKQAGLFDFLKSKPADEWNPPAAPDYAKFDEAGDYDGYDAAEAAYKTQLQDYLKGRGYSDIKEHRYEPWGEPWSMRGRDGKYYELPIISGEYSNLGKPEPLENLYDSGNPDQVYRKGPGLVLVSSPNTTTHNWDALNAQSKKSPLRTKAEVQKYLKNWANKHKKDPSYADDSWEDLEENLPLRWGPDGFNPDYLVDDLHVDIGNKLRDPKQFSAAVKALLPKLHLNQKAAGGNCPALGKIMSINDNVEPDIEVLDELESEMFDKAADYDINNAPAWLRSIMGAGVFGGAGLRGGALAGGLLGAGHGLLTEPGEYVDAKGEKQKRTRLQKVLHDALSGVGIGGVTGGAIGAAGGAALPFLPTKQSSSPAWQRSAGKNPEGGLNEKGRKSYEREHGGNLKAPVTESNPSGERAKRQNSFCSRMCGMKRVNTGAETKSDPDSRINKSLRKWNCKCSSAFEFGQAVSHELQTKESSSKAQFFLNGFGGGRYQFGEGSIAPEVGYKHLFGVVPFPFVGVRIGNKKHGLNIRGPWPSINYSDATEPHDTIWNSHRSHASGWMGEKGRSLWGLMADGFKSPNVAFMDAAAALRDSGKTDVKDFEGLLRHYGYGQDSQRVRQFAELLANRAQSKVPGKLDDAADDIAHTVELPSVKAKGGRNGKTQEMIHELAGEIAG